METKGGPDANILSYELEGLKEEIQDMTQKEGNWTMTEIQCRCGKVYDISNVLEMIIAALHMKITGDYIRYYKMPDMKDWKGPIKEP